METETIGVEFRKKNGISKKLLPLILTFVIIVLDQITKALVVKFLPVGKPLDLLGSFLRFTHVRNNAVAFSMGSSLPDTARFILFAVIPLIVIILVYFFYFKTNDFTYFQRWIVCGILGGGLGNLIDRFFRPNGVVDFVDFKWFGLNTKLSFFSWNRFPTFNVADMAVVICAILLVISYIVIFAKEKKNKAK
jgi:signal peptidase II